MRRTDAVCVHSPSGSTFLREMVMTAILKICLHIRIWPGHSMRIYMKNNPTIFFPIRFETMQPQVFFKKFPPTVVVAIVVVDTR